jgi:hypothetical protein
MNISTEEVPRTGPRRSRHLLLWLYTCSIVGILALGIVLVTREARPPLPVNASLTKEAWDAFSKGDYAHAIGSAQKVINEFSAEADRLQQELSTSAETENDSSDPARRQAILSRGPLNDVATCYFIVGRSAKYLNDKKLADSAFSHASLYTHALALNADGSGFWSPAKAAEKALQDLR